MKKTIIIVSELIHNLQLERGRVAGYLGSEGVLFDDDMHKQFVTTDAHIKKFADIFSQQQTAHSLKQDLLNKQKALLGKCNDLLGLRKETENKQQLTWHMLDFYSNELIGPLIQNIIEVAWGFEDCDPNALSAYSAFLYWEEHIGLERAIALRGFIHKHFENEEFVERILFLLSKQNNYQSAFFAVANETQKRLTNKVLESDICNKIDELHVIFKNDPKSTQLQELSLDDWFDLITAKMDALQSVEPKLIDTLSRIENQRDGVEIKASVSSGLNNIEAYKDLIKSMRLFSKLSSDNLEKVIGQGQVRKLDKGSLLFLEGEAPNRLYIILRGWVKIFKGTIDGDETILQMLTAGDSILESAIFLNNPFPMNAQAVEDVLVLSIPAPIFREQLRNNNDLAYNLLTSMAYRSHGLIRQIEDARLKTVDERVGWFLLRLLLENGRKSTKVALPYDKAMIASYLDMKRETFSRALKRLKEKDFIVENLEITIPDLDSLCKYCNEETANFCTEYECEKLEKFDIT